MEQLVDALDLVPLYVVLQVEDIVFDCAAKGLLAVKSCVEQLASKYAIDGQANQQHTICLINDLFDQWLSQQADLQNCR